MTLAIVGIDPDARPARKRARKSAPRPIVKPAKVVPIRRADGMPLVEGRLLAIVENGVTLVAWPGALVPVGSDIPEVNRWAFGHIAAFDPDDD